ncbi:benzoate/H(+) symporter BenE family transporter [Schumannella sp. 10F1B-5-1]|uniref:benzoate/H(+) symporter BenE family transporter n=1 Tax=Schumannella sp. 10F1B-5-1 TaxID=2590780 RepID=UPI0011317F98|nr:benzoate/H(+) symporter BenE family transporter [Schumannella sp. 10F1B-5-1]TPW70143.1 benzoate/H(+) symporter BenE family transporter [Schumannella sp. 10F1B-5-1]
MSAGTVGAVTGFASSFALVIAGLTAVGATPEEASSGLLVLCLGQALLAIVLSLRFRLPLSFAWSTPGAAVLVAAGATTGDYSAAVGAFLVASALMVITGFWPWLARMATSIPKPIASAMLAGILFPICISPVQATVEHPLLALPPIVIWLLLSRLAPRWAVPGAVAATAVAVLVAAGPSWTDGAHLAPVLTFTAPTFDPAVIVGIGVPLYLVTMAGQQIPGFTVLSTFGYPQAPTRTILASTGIVSAAGATLGGFQVNLSALTAAIMAGPDSHPDRDRRWIASLTGGILYLAIGFGAGVAAALVQASPPVLIESAAGLALLGALITAVVGALEDARHRVVAIATFLVVASGVAVGGIGSAVLGLVVGGVMMLVLNLGRRRAER